MTPVLIDALSPLGAKRLRSGLPRSGPLYLGWPCSSLGCHLGFGHRAFWASTPCLGRANAPRPPWVLLLGSKFLSRS
jgi:hypothetical protein